MCYNDNKSILINKELIANLSLMVNYSQYDFQALKIIE